MRAKGAQPARTAYGGDIFRQVKGMGARACPIPCAAPFLHSAHPIHLG